MECNNDVIKDIIIVIVCIYYVETLDVLNMSKGKHDNVLYDIIITFHVGLPFDILRTSNVST
jgi:hypothetical protein